MPLVLEPETWLPEAVLLEEVGPHDRVRGFSNVNRASMRSSRSVLPFLRVLAEIRDYPRLVQDQVTYTPDTIAAVTRFRRILSRSLLTNRGSHIVLPLFDLNTR